jgi:hypothetical protein
MSCRFWSPWVWTFPFKHPCVAHAFFPAHMSNHCQGLCHTFSEICTKYHHTFCQSHCIRPDTWLHIKRCKKLECQPSCESLYADFPRYANTIIYCCIMLLHLLYRWQHQSGKLQIADGLYVFPSFVVFVCMLCADGLPAKKEAQFISATIVMDLGKGGLQHCFHYM